MLDLRAKMKKLMDDSSHYVLLQRTSRKIRCYCWNEIAQESNPQCPGCLGVGWVSVIERHRIRHDSATQTVARPNLSLVSDPGRSWVDAVTIYFEHDSYPSIDDYVYEVGWDAKNPKKPTHLLRVYKINDIYTERGYKGRAEYHVASARAETTRTQFRNVIIRSMGAVENYHLTE